MGEYKRLKDNLDILENHNEIHTPIFHLTDGKTHEQDLIRELISDCRELLNKLENGTLIELPCKVGDTVYCIYHFDGWFEEDDMEYDIIPEEVVDIIIKEEDFDIGTSWSMIGKFQRVCVCFSIAEAEEKLKKLKGEV